MNLKDRFNMDEYQWSTNEDVDSMLLFLRFFSPFQLPITRQLRLFCCACCRQVWYCLHNRPERVAIELFEKLIDSDTQDEVEHPIYSQMKSVLPCNPGWNPHTAIDKLASYVRFWSIGTEMTRTREVSKLILDQSANDRAAVTWRNCYPDYFDMLFALSQARNPHPTVVVGPSYPPPINSLGWSGDEAEPLAIAVGLRLQITEIRRRECRGEDYNLQRDRMALWGQLHTITRREENRRLTDALRDIVGNPFPPFPINGPWPKLVADLAQDIYITQDYSHMDNLRLALEDAGYSDREVLAHCAPDIPHVRGCWVLDLILGRK